MPITEDALSKILTKILENSSAPISTVTTSVSERPKRCQHSECKKKLMLSDMACKCEKYFCQGHRYAESHSCTFDYKTAGSKILEKQLVKTVALKIEQI